MFDTQSYMDVVSESGRKRGRDGEGEMDGISMGLEEHRSKRIQCLPLRTSPRSSQQWQSASSVTPLNSDSDDPISQPYFAPWSHPSTVDPPVRGGAEVNMMSSGRMPTPIQPSFAAQVRGQQSEWAGPGPVVTTLNGLINMGHHPSGFSDDQCVPRVMSGLEDWQAVQNHRRLPSPISEVEDCVPDQHFGEASMMVDDGMGVTTDATAVLPPSLTRVMDHPNAMMDMESPPHSHPHAADFGGDAPSPSPARRGHIRSKHTINSWTWQPGMKKSFSIGYRADCEKCRLKVPGHFNHIVIS
ncbi:hypothetical protein Trco_005110 [Trichoderma cornu-damae]|uniref:Uncharacterized protein n=1 Tax=Trichoderma cornu-damae TaxID=654480 RepID=A0A9P8QNW7_9HYPO|nr:hypothetical protein Trco_005110 [Trichoderma cornu-damae]